MACKKVRRKQKSKKRGQERGQMTIVGVLAVFITLIVYVVLYPVLDEIISNASITGVEGTLLRLFPAMILISILAGLLIYATPTRAREA